MYHFTRRSVLLPRLYCVGVTLQLLQLLLSLLPLLPLLCLRYIIRC